MWICQDRIKFQYSVLVYTGKFTHASANFPVYTCLSCRNHSVCLKKRMLELSLTDTPWLVIPNTWPNSREPCLQISAIQKKVHLVLEYLLPTAFLLLDRSSTEMEKTDTPGLFHLHTCWPVRSPPSSRHWPISTVENSSLYLPNFLTLFFPGLSGAHRAGPMYVCA